MNPLEEVVRIEEELKKKLIHNPKVSTIDISLLENNPTSGGEEYAIRVFVNDPHVSY